MQKYNLYEAKTHFSKIMNLVEHNEEVIISKHGKPIAKIIPFCEPCIAQRQFGTLKGQIKVAADFDAPLPKELLQGFYAGDDDESTT